MAANSFPEVLDVRCIDTSGRQIEAELFVPAALAHFSGHFPGAPILPGVVQIDWAVRLAREHLAIDGVFTGLEAIKFQSLIKPDSRLLLTLNWSPDRGRLEFSFSSGQIVYSSGRIVFGNLT